MNFPNRQRGVGVIGWLILLLVFGSFMTGLTKIAPLYMDHRTMSIIMDKMAAEPEAGKMSKRRIISTLQNRFKLNNIRNFPLEDSLSFETTKIGKKVFLKYEERVPLIYNIDLIASFTKEIELKN